MFSALSGAGSTPQSRIWHEISHRGGNTAYTDIARGLGCQFHHRLVFFPEINNRIKAARIGFATMRGFWKSRSPWSVKRLILVIKVLSPVISGMEAFIFTAWTYNQLNTTFAKLCRKAA